MLFNYDSRLWQTLLRISWSLWDGNVFAAATAPNLTLSDENTDSRLRRWCVLSNSSGFSFLHLGISALGL